MPVTEAQSDALIAAVRVVAASEILPRFRNLADGEIDAKAAFDDLVTVADRAAEAALTERVHAILPDAEIVGEEAVSEDRAILDRVAAGRCIVIDPIDGTWNFAHGVANYGIIVAVLERGETVWGLLYDPSFDDWIVAHREQGAWFHRRGRARRLAVPQDPAPLELLRGNVNLSDRPGEPRRELAATIPLFRRASSYGASMHEYRLLSLGASDFCLNDGLNVWDHAAGILVLHEAGGTSRMLDGRDYAPAMREGRLLNARSAAMWDELAAVFNGAIEG